MRWALIRSSDGAWLSPAAGETTKPTAVDGQHVIAIASGYPDTASYVPASNAFIDLMSEAACLAMIDTKAGQLRLAQITSVPGQADLYRRKQAEVDKMATLGSTVAAILSALNLMTPAARAAAYPLLTLEMQVMGYSDLTKAYTMVTNAIAAANAKLNAIELVRRQTKVAIRAAATLAAKNTAAVAAAWPT
ncbi:hypothetical protein [Sphingomonas nostoxanthinifaciens]|uniref:hypothetical protein n=1 Tax=Sphingomonas nostoxanthinifaciens TaxID=2872652 RepID=UPI001CC1E763|nr:hypothetical protein [Sphingomonas nostoxanthinifaciens]UAK24339.1 hypothetical protein K8P63_18835 [Sphingomonas nostoxanthinifaciens]